MLQQMLAEDKADMVREAVIKSLGIIMGYIDDPDKYSQVCLSRQKGVALPCLPTVLQTHYKPASLVSSSSRVLS